MIYKFQKFAKKILLNGSLNLLLFFTLILSTILIIAFNINSFSISQNSMIYAINQSGSYQSGYRLFNLLLLVILIINIIIFGIIAIYIVALKTLKIKILKAKLQYKISFISQILTSLLLILHLNIINNLKQLNNYNQCQQASSQTDFCKKILTLNTPEMSITNIGDYYKNFLFIITGILVIISILNILSLFTFFIKMRGNLKHAKN